MRVVAFALPGESPCPVANLANLYDPEAVIFTGGFARNTRALDTFGRAPDHITNAYIVWALTESGGQDDIANELNALAEQAKKSDDPYFVSLVALSPRPLVLPLRPHVEYIRYGWCVSCLLTSVDHDGLPRLWAVVPAFELVCTRLRKGDSGRTRSCS